MKWPAAPFDWVSSQTTRLAVWQAGVAAAWAAPAVAWPAAAPIAASEPSAAIAPSRRERMSGREIFMVPFEVRSWTVATGDGPGPRPAYPGIAAAGPPAQGRSSHVPPADRVQCP